MSLSLAAEAPMSLSVWYEAVDIFPYSGAHEWSFRDDRMNVSNEFGNAYHFDVTPPQAITVDVGSAYRYLADLPDVNAQSPFILLMRPAHFLTHDFLALL